MTRANPYNYTLPTTQKMFSGREDDLDILAHQLTTTPGNSFLLVGGRRMGKTSLLEALEQVLKTKKNIQSLIPVPITLDLMGANIDSLASFFYTLCEASEGIVEKMLPKEIYISYHSHENKSPLQIFQLALENWNELFKDEYRRRLRLILLLDECEEILGHQWSLSVLGALRSLLIGQKTRDILKVVMAGSHHLLTQTKQRGSPLWPILTPHKLKVLSFQETSELITKPAKVNISTQTIQAIVSQSGGHAFLTQYIMYHLWERGIENATPELVEHIATIFPGQPSDFRDWFNCFGSTGRMVYNALVRSSGSVQEETIIRTIRAVPLEVVDALDMLCYHGLILKEANRATYQVTSEMFRSWFIKYQQDNKGI